MSDNAVQTQDDAVTPKPCGVLVVVAHDEIDYVLACNRAEGHDGDHRRWALGIASWEKR